MKNIIGVLTLFLVLVLLSGCAKAMEPARPSETLPVLLTVAPLAATETPQPTATLTPAPTLTPTPFKPFEAVVTLNNLFLRSGPGFLLPTKGMYNYGDIVDVLGRAPGWSWVYVGTKDGQKGFMKLELLDLKVNFYDAPVVIPDGYVIVKGHFYAPNGNPASHITLTLIPPGGTNADADAATTDALGVFYFFLPPDSTGNWTLEASGYGCESSAVNTTCSLIGVFPPAVEIDVKNAAEVWQNVQMTNS